MIKTLQWNIPGTELSIGGIGDTMGEMCWYDIGKFESCLNIEKYRLNEWV